MGNPKGVKCRLKTPGDWPIMYHQVIVEAAKSGKVIVYEGPEKKEVERHARAVRGLVKRLLSYPMHSTTQAASVWAKSFRTSTKQTGIQEWQLVLKSGPQLKNRLFDEL